MAQGARRAHVSSTPRPRAFVFFYFLLLSYNCFSICARAATLHITNIFPRQLTNPPRRPRAGEYGGCVCVRARAPSPRPVTRADNRLLASNFHLPTPNFPDPGRARLDCVLLLIVVCDLRQLLLLRISRAWIVCGRTR